MVKNRILIVFILGLMISVTSCNAYSIKGSGDLVTETVPVSNFDKIVFNGSGQMIVTQNGRESLTIETDDNVMKYVKAEVEDGTLKLGFVEGNYSISPSQLVFKVNVDNLTGLSISGSGEVESELLETGLLEVNVSGSGDVQINNLTTKDLTANISGSGELFLTGIVETQDLKISGSGKYFSGDVCSRSISVKVSDSGNVTICALESLNSNISGSGSVNYFGQPSIDSITTDSGSLTHLGNK